MTPFPLPPTSGIPRPAAAHGLNGRHVQRPTRYETRPGRTVRRAPRSMRRFPPRPRDRLPAPRQRRPRAGLARAGMGAGAGRLLEVGGEGVASAPRSGMDVGEEGGMTSAPRPSPARSVFLGGFFFLRPRLHGLLPTARTGLAGRARRSRTKIGRGGEGTAAGWSGAVGPGQ